MKFDVTSAHSRIRLMCWISDLYMCISHPNISLSTPHVVLCATMSQFAKVKFVTGKLSRRFFVTMQSISQQKSKSCLTWTWYRLTAPRRRTKSYKMDKPCVPTEND
jgi:hypothetical protein